MMQRKLILAALALVLTISSASAQENPYRLPQMPAQATSFNKLLYAYRLYAFVKDCNIHEELVERHILLSECADEIVELKARDRQYRLVVQFRVVETIQKMNPAGPRGGETDA